MDFRIEEDFWALFPAVRIGVVIAHGIANEATGKKAQEAATLLAQTAAQTGAVLQDDTQDIVDIAAYPAVAPWREAYQTFGAKPNKYRSSIENLLRSARAGSVRSINPLVDLYNSVSLRHQLPCGGEDLAAVVGDIRLTRAVGDELFVPLGSPDPQTSQPPQAGEVIYRDDEGVLCRAWNWREAERTKLTTATRDAFLCIEVLPPLSEESLRAACTDLAELVSTKLSADCRVEILSRHRPIVTL
ncbi:MAG: phenylalanine--tRNA ligase beta subunit-related protein [Chloroflexota bacterium]|nr:phenylalanine--tRNA ligase beta subunit-related protein [Chloroflexota bacterium]MDQ5865479.1 phenylalanine--tRNA ligase beta subunit-related protein [Chloroflexota bacterium]